MHTRFVKSLLPTFPPVQQLTVYDIRGVSQDRQLTSTIIAGITNRLQPRVYLITHDDDAFWLQQIPSSIPKEFLPAKGQEAFLALLTASLSQMRGVIIYDPALPDTINVATTLAGQQDGLVVSPELANELQQAYQLPILSDLRSYHWQSRAQAYHWAQQHLLPTTSTAIIAGLNPRVFCALRSFLVATRAFVYWLDTRKYLPEHAVPSFSERSLLKKLLSSLAPEAVHLGWVVHEQSAVALCSRYGIPVIASDYTVNLEVWGAIPVAVAPPVVASAPALASASISPVSVSSPLPVSRPDKKKIYVSFTMSDGDNLQYCQHRLRTIWQDSARGSVPLGWTLSPLLPQCMPALAAYYTRTATANDELICSPSGMGYMYPSRWPREQRMRYFQQTGTLMQQLGMTTIELFDIAPLYSTGLPLLATFSLTGMGMIDVSVQQECVAVLRDFGVRGILGGVGYTGFPASAQCIDGLVIYQNPGFTYTAKQTVMLIKMAARFLRRRPLFLNVYLIAWTMTPTLVRQVMDELGSAYTFVLPRTLLELQKCHEKACSCTPSAFP